MQVASTTSTHCGSIERDVTRTALAPSSPIPSSPRRSVLLRPIAIRLRRRPVALLAALLGLALLSEWASRRLRGVP